MYSDNETLEQKAACVLLPVAIGLYNAVGSLRRLWQWARYQAPLWKLWVAFAVAAGLFVCGFEVLPPLSKTHPNIVGVTLLTLTLTLYLAIFTVVPITVRRASDSVKKATLKLYRELYRDP